MNTRTSQTLASQSQESHVILFTRLFYLLALICATAVFATPTYAGGYKVYITPVNDSTTLNSKVRIAGYRSFNVHVVKTPGNTDAGGKTVYFYTDRGTVNTNSAVTDSRGVTGFSLWGGWSAGTATVRAKVVATNGQDYSHTAFVPVVKPSGEDSSFSQWQETVGVWSARLTPIDVNFDGLQVTERAPKFAGGPDTCYYFNNPSGATPFTAVTGAGQPFGTVHGHNYYGFDGVGWYPEAVTGYRNGPGPTPCGTSFTQYMDVIVPGGNLYYKTNVLKASIQPLTVTSGRDGLSKTTTWPYTPSAVHLPEAE